MLSIRSKTIIAILGVILTISASYFFFFLKQRDQSKELIIQCKKDLVTSLVASMTSELNNQYSARIKSFALRHEQIIRNFAERNRERLYEAAVPVYETLRRENSYFDHINFILPDKTVFLRLHNPDRYGDKEQYTCSVYTESVSNPTEPVSGFVYGSCGILYRVIQPLYFNQQYIGNVLFGIRMGSFVNDIKKDLDMHTALALRKDLAEQSGNSEIGGIDSGKYIIHHFDDPFFKAEGAKLNLTGREQQFLHDGDVHYVFPSYVIRDRDGEEIGRIIQGLDLTQVVHSYRADIYRLAGVTSVVLALASVILYLAFSRLLGELVTLNRQLQTKNSELIEAGQQLEAQVLKRTEELAEANTKLMQEIEERHKTNLSLIRSIEEWQSTFDAIADPVVILDTDLDVVIANKAAKEMLTREDREIVGRPCHELFAGSREVCENCPAGDVFTRGLQKEYEIEHEHLGKNLLVSCSPIYDGDEVTGYIHTAKDITQEKILKKQLAQAQKMEAIATLAGGIAHDFNNILGAILGNADLLLFRMTPPPGSGTAPDKIELAPEEIRTHMEAIKKAGNRAKELVSQILAFSRQGKTRRQNVLITPVIKEGIKLLRSSLPANIEIASSIEPQPCHIFADLSQIHQVFMNLCTNAAQAMEEHGGSMDISLFHFQADTSSRKRYPDLKPGKYLALSVKDTGHGMSPEIQERIFEPFFTTRDVGEGTGMGLSVIHGIITAHEGVLDVQSQVDVGSEFTVFFPCVDKEREYAEDPVLGVPRGKEKVLFVDDEYEIVKMSASMLQYLGYTVYPATSGEKALELLQLEAADAQLVICDYSMPGMSGTELAAEISRRRQDLPVILCSGFSESVVLDDETKKVIRKFMSKPLDMRKLAIAIREVLS